MGHKPINVKAYWVLLGPKFKRIKDYFYSLKKKRGSKCSLRKEELDKLICQEDLISLERFLEIFSSFTEDDRVHIEIREIKDFIKTSRKRLEDLEFNKRMGLPKVNLTKYLSSVETISELLKVG